MPLTEDQRARAQQKGCSGVSRSHQAALTPSWTMTQAQPAELRQAGHQQRPGTPTGPMRRSSLPAMEPPGQGPVPCPCPNCTWSPGTDSGACPFPGDRKPRQPSVRGQNQSPQNPPWDGGWVWRGGRGETGSLAACTARLGPQRRPGHNKDEPAASSVSSQGGLWSVAPVKEEVPEATLTASIRMPGVTRSLLK